MNNIVTTGTKCKVSGQYKPVGSNTEITLVSGRKVPPTSNGCTKFKLVDKTRHKK